MLAWILFVGWVVSLLGVTGILVHWMATAPAFADARPEYGTFEHDHRYDGNHGRPRGWGSRVGWGLGLVGALTFWAWLFVVV